MVGNLLLRGMLVGLAAAVVCFVFLRIFGEPSIAQAIALEEAASVVAPGDGAPDGHDHAMSGSAGHTHAADEAPGHSHGEDALVSRVTQAGTGLFLAVSVFGAALGGLFAISFALVYGRWEALGPRGTSALLGLFGFISICLVPFLKYPPNPPAVGSAETIGLRTGLYVAMLALSLAGMIAALVLRGALTARHGRWNASLIAGGAYLLGMGVVALLLPGIHEVPDSFPAPVLWSFRMASLGGHAILWSVIALGFGLLTHRAARRAPGAPLGSAIA